MSQGDDEQVSKFEYNRLFFSTLALLREGPFRIPLDLYSNRHSLDVDILTYRLLLAQLIHLALDKSLGLALMCSALDFTMGYAC